MIIGTREHNEIQDLQIILAQFSDDYGDIEDLGQIQLPDTSYKQINVSLSGKNVMLKFDYLFLDNIKYNQFILTKYIRCLTQGITCMTGYYDADECFDGIEKICDSTLFPHGVKKIWHNSTRYVFTFNIEKLTIDTGFALANSLPFIDKNRSKHIYPELQDIIIEFSKILDRLYKDSYYYSINGFVEKLVDDDEYVIDNLGIILIQKPIMLHKYIYNLIFIRSTDYKKIIAHDLNSHDEPTGLLLSCKYIRNIYLYLNLSLHNYYNNNNIHMFLHDSINSPFYVMEMQDPDLHITHISNPEYRYYEIYNGRLIVLTSNPEYTTVEDIWNYFGGWRKVSRRDVDTCNKYVRKKPEPHKRKDLRIKIFFNKTIDTRIYVYYPEVMI